MVLCVMWCDVWWVVCAVCVCCDVCVCDECGG